MHPAETVWHDHRDLGPRNGESERFAMNQRLDSDNRRYDTCCGRRSSVDLEGPVNVVHKDPRGQKTNRAWYQTVSAPFRTERTCK